MYESALQVFSPILAMMVNVFTQVMIFRRKIISSLLYTIFLGFFSGLVTVIVTNIINLTYVKSSLFNFSGIMFANIIIYGSLSYCYFHFINLGETARRIRLLREIIDSKNGLTPFELLELYNANKVLSYRIERLLRNKQIVLQNDKYLIGNPSVLWFANIITLLKIMVLGKKSEFD